MNEISAEIREFALRSYEQMDLLEKRLAGLQGGPDASKHWSDLCPAFYDLSERASSFRFQRLQSLSQTVEYVLKRLDRFQIYPQPQVIGYLFNLAADLRRHLDHITSSGTEAAPGGSRLPEPASPSRVAHNLIPFNPLPMLQKTLVFRTPDDGRMAMPFDNVMRLESFPATGQGGAVNGTNGSVSGVPTVDISRLLPERRLVFRRPPVQVHKNQTRQMIVYFTPYGEVGLVVDSVLDVLKARLEVQRPAARIGALGSMELNDRITEILDIPAILSQSGLVFSESGIVAGAKIAS